MVVYFFLEQKLLVLLEESELVISPVPPHSVIASARWRPAIQSWVLVAVGGCMKWLFVFCSTRRYGKLGGILSQMSQHFVGWHSIYLANEFMSSSHGSSSIDSKVFKRKDDLSPSPSVVWFHVVSNRSLELISDTKEIQVDLFDSCWLIFFEQGVSTTTLGGHANCHKGMLLSCYSSPIRLSQLRNIIVEWFHWTGSGGSNPFAGGIFFEKGLLSWERSMVCSWLTWWIIQLLS